VENLGDWDGGGTLDCAGRRRRTLGSGPRSNGSRRATARCNAGTPEEGCGESGFVTINPVDVGFAKWQAVNDTAPQ